jgi:hypothetical protein
MAPRGESRYTLDHVTVTVTAKGTQSHHATFYHACIMPPAAAQVWHAEAPPQLPICCKAHAGFPLVASCYPCLLQIPLHTLVCNHCVNTALPISGYMWLHHTAQRSHPGSKWVCPEAWRVGGHSVHAWCAAWEYVSWQGPRHGHHNQHHGAYSAELHNMVPTSATQLHGNYPRSSNSSRPIQNLATHEAPPHCTTVLTNLLSGSP